MILKSKLTPEQQAANLNRLRLQGEAFTATDSACHAFLTQSESGRECVRFARRFARENHNVLITGETGTGKELIARILHGERDRNTFRAVNCASLPDTLFESELFGYEPGTFTGGLRDGKQGMIERARGGTLFLDEIGELPLTQQSKLLRVLQEGEFYKLGGNTPIKASCRWIFATNRDLGAEVAAKRFRADLFFRLYILHVHIPPLRERPDDVMLIAHAECEKLGMDTSDLPPLDELNFNEGNVRQLQGEIIRAFYGK